MLDDERQIREGLERRDAKWRELCEKAEKTAEWALKKLEKRRKCPKCGEEF